MKSCSRILTAVALVAAVCSCAKNTRIDGSLHEGEGRDVIVKLLDVNRFQVLDTVKAGADGRFTYTLDLEDGKPEFIYLYYGERQIASLLLQKGDKVQVTTDTLGVYAVEGSEESLKLQQVEADYNTFIRDMTTILSREPNPDPLISRRYVEYYRDRLTYVMSNSTSLTVVPVFFQQVNPSLPVFDQPTDGLVMRKVCDDLQAVYPESRYVKALDREARRRQNLLDLNTRLEQAGEVGFVDITLPGIDGKAVSLSEVNAKVTMLYFWASTNQQKMFNLDALVPLYEEFHPKSFEIYAVSLDSDKSAWAAAVKNQQLPWVNVCDTRGAQSPYVGSYGIGSLPMVWFIVDGSIDSEANASNAAEIREYLRRKL